MVHMNDLPNPDVSGAIPADAIVRALAGVVGSVEAAIVRLGGDDAEPDTVDKILAAAGAPDLGDVVAHHNTLTRAIAIVDHRGSLPEEEWGTIAELGPLLSVVVQRLRAYAVALLDPVEPGITVSAHVALLLTMADEADSVRRCSCSCSSRTPRPCGSDCASNTPALLDRMN